MNSQKIAVVTDSTNDLPAELIEKHAIIVVPLTLVWDGQTYLDGVQITAPEFYQRLENQSSHPSTSQPSPREFLSAYQSAIDTHADEIVAITISSAMSGTITSARTAAKEVDIPVHIVDSKANTMALGWQVLAAARARDAGGSAEEILAAIEAVRAKVHLHVVLDTVEYLFKGGRIASAAKMLSNVLQIKPQIKVNHNSGSVEAVDISRTRTRALQSLFSNFFKRVDPVKPFRLAVIHNNVLEDAKALADRIQAEFHPVELLISYSSPILGVHTGPRAIGLCGYND